jgi:hypothetical protein
MTIVPTGNLSLQVPESGSDEFVFELVQNMRELILHLAIGWGPVKIHMPQAKCRCGAMCA